MDLFVEVHGGLGLGEVAPAWLAAPTSASEKPSLPPP